VSITESVRIEGNLDELRTWPTAVRLRLARMILETVDTHPFIAPPRQGSLGDLPGIRKTAVLPPTDEECRAALDGGHIR
jgi:hypothetical protein